MQTVPGKCPDERELKAFLNGGVDDARIDAISNHIESCQTCCDALETLFDRASGEHTGRAAEASGKPTADAGPFQHPACLEFVERIKQRSGTGDAANSQAFLDTGGLRPGSRIGRYELLQTLGEGGMGVVYLARDTESQALVALKLLPPDRQADAKALTRFRKEIRSAQRLRHPGFVRALDAGEDQRRLYLALEYVAGQDLSRVLDRHHGRLPIAAACEIVRQAALAMQSAFEHERQMVHRDLKPANLMLTSKGEVKVLDVGLALWKESAESTQAHTMAGRPIGTLDFMSPEQCHDSHAVDIRSDIYSLGATLFKLLCGEAPFDLKRFPGQVIQLRQLAQINAIVTQPPPSILDRRGDVPPELAQVLERTLARDPSQRYATPRELAEALQPFTADADLRSIAPRPQDLPILAGSSTPRPKSVLKQQRPRWLAAGLLALLAAFVVRIATDKGEIEIQVPDGARVEVRVKQNGRVVQLLDSRSRPIGSLKTGRYELELADPQSSFKLNNDQITVLRGKKTQALIVRRPGLFDPDTTGVGELEIDSPSDAMFAVRVLRGGREAAVLNRASPRVSLTSGTYDLTLVDPENSLQMSADRIEVKSDQRVMIPIRRRAKMSWTGSRMPVEPPVTALRHARRLVGHRDLVTDLTVSQVGRRALSSSQRDFGLILWDVESGGSLRKYDHHKNWVLSVAMSPDGKSGLSGGLDERLILFDLQSGAVQQEFRGHRGGITCCAFVPGRDEVVSGSGALWNGEWSDTGDNDPRVWNAKTGELVRTLKGHTSRIHRLRVSSDGKRVLSAGFDNTACCWNLETGDLLTRFTTHTAPVFDVAFVESDAETKAISVDEAGVMIEWDRENGNEIQRIHLTDIFGSVAVSPNGRRLITTHGNGGVVRLWSRSPFRELYRFQGNPEVAWLAKFVGENEALIGGGHGGPLSQPPHDLQFWTLPAGEQPFVRNPFGVADVLEQDLEELDQHIVALFEELKADTNGANAEAWGDLDPTATVENKLSGEWGSRWKCPQPNCRWHYGTARLKQLGNVVYIHHREENAPHDEYLIEAVQVGNQLVGRYQNLAPMKSADRRPWVAWVVGPDRLDGFWLKPDGYAKRWDLRRRLPEPHERRAISPDFAAEREVAEWVQRVGGRVGTLDRQGRPATFLASQPLPAEPFFVTDVDLIRCVGVEPGDLRRLTPLSRLRWLSLASLPQINDSCLPDLQKMTKLEFLNLGGTSIKGAGAARLTPLHRLKHLNLAMLKLSGDLSPLANLTSLEELFLNDTTIGDAELETLVGLPHLRSLGVVGTNITERGLTSLAKNYPGLKMVELGSPPQGGLTPKSLTILRSFPLLDEVQLDPKLFTDETLRLLSELPLLKSLYLNGPIPAERLAKLDELRQLERLCLQQVPLTGSWHETFARLDKLFDLRLWHMPLSDEQLLELQHIPELKRVEIRACPNLTSPGLAAFRAARPQCVIDADIP